MKKEVIDKIAALITAGFGLIAALAWNDAIRSIFNYIFGTPDKISAMLTYAVLVTIIAVAITIYIGKLSQKAMY